MGHGLLLDGSVPTLFFSIRESEQNADTGKKPENEHDNEPGVGEKGNGFYPFISSKNTDNGNYATDKPHNGHDNSGKSHM
jgi:hypothetical protein